MTSFWENVRICWRDLFKKLKHVRSHKITVEPIIFCYVAAWTMQSLLTTNLLIEKVCTITLKEEENCTSHPTYKSKEDDIHLAVSQLNMYSKLIQNIPSILFVLFLGSWSDKNGRKIPMILPFIGCLVSSIFCVINSYFWNLPAEQILVASIPRAISGGFISLMMASYSYISDISDEVSRTTRIAFVDVTFVISPLVGVYFSNLLLNAIGYSGSYALSGCVYLLCMIYIIFYIKDSRGPLTDNSSESDAGLGTKLVEANHLKMTLNTFLHRRENRSRILLLMFINCFMNLVYGSVGLDYLYVQKKFSWSYSDYTHFAIFQLGFSGIGTSILLPLLSFKLNVGDFLLGFMGSISKLLECLVIGFGSSDFHLYIGAFIGSIGKVPISVTRAAVSKMVSQEEIGRIFSLMASLESLIPIVSNPLYTFAYNATIESLPGTIYFMSAGIYIVSAVIFLCLMLV